MNTEHILDVYAGLEPMALTLLAPIATEEAHEAALQAIDGLMERMGQEENHPLRPLFEILAEHVEAYEAEHIDLPDSPPLERLAYLMNTHDLTQTQLAEATGIPQSNISAVLRGTREISKGMAKKLADHFRLEIGVFLD